ncbi:MAG: hypothetical protein ACFFKA_12195, partial [Candidatus Thorarchaeota archaeon]
MNFIDKDTLKTQFLKVSHDLQRRILEIPSFIRVLNNYYYLKTRIQNQIKPLVLSNLKKSIQTLEFERDWIYSIPSKLTKTSDDYLTTKDSFKFPDSIILFEAWMNLGIRALFPRTAFHYRFPGFLKGEKIRNLIQFTFATSRGFGFPIYFGPEFYQYKLTYGKFLEAIFKWSHTVCHRANQAINLVGNRYRIERHHPGEFESVIISEFEKGNFKTIDTLLHGYFTNAPKKLGQFSDLNSVLERVVFSYSIGDHAMSTKLINQEKVLEVPLITYEDIVKRYNINFFSYISKLKAFRLLLIKKIILYKQQKKELLSKINISNKSKSRLSSRQLTLNIKIIEKLLQMLWITPLYTHTYH